MRAFCQVVIVAFIVFEFFASLWCDYHGSVARKPWGCPGALITVAVTALVLLVLLGAGALSEVTAIFR